MSVKRGRGRPSLPPHVKKRHNLTFRLRDALREKLDEVSASSGRSRSEEVEYRLEQSFDQQEVARALAHQLWRDMATVIQEQGGGSARAFAVNAWGEAWTANEWDLLLQFAALVSKPQDNTRSAA